MSWRPLKNRQKISQIIKLLILKKRDIKVKIKGDNRDFRSRIILFNDGESLSDTFKEPVMIIEKLTPDKGSSLIQSAQSASLEFQINDSSVKCSVNYMGISSTPPYFGFIVTLPESLEIEEKRSEERFAFDLPDFVSAVFRINEGTLEEKTYELGVMDCSKHGLGLIIDMDNLDLIKKIKKGTVINDMTFYASRSMIRVSGTVQHITRLEQGQHINCYLLGIESRDIIESCRKKDE